MFPGRGNSPSWKATVSPLTGFNDLSAPPQASQPAGCCCGEASECRSGRGDAQQSPSRNSISTSRIPCCVMTVLILAFICYQLEEEVLVVADPPIALMQRPDVIHVIQPLPECRSGYHLPPTAILCYRAHERCVYVTLSP